MKKISKVFSLVSVLLVLLALVGNLALVEAKSVKKAEAKPDVVNIGYQVIPNDELLAKAKKWYEKELGVKVNFVQFDSGRDVNTAIVGKNIDIGLVGSSPVAIGISRGIPYEVFWVHDVIGDAEALAVKNKANIKTIKDLRGKKVAVPVASTAHYSLLNALKLAGVKPGEVTVLDLQPPDILAAWQRGDIDAAYVWQPTLGKLLDDGKILVSSAGLAKKGIVTADLGVVRKEFADKYPDLVSKYIKLQFKSYNYFKKTPDKAAEAIATELRIDKTEIAKQLNEVIWLSGTEQISGKYLGTSKKKGDFAKTLKATADFLVQQKAIDSAPGLAAFIKAVNPKYIEEALKK